jgi:hypothetical protein
LVNAYDYTVWVGATTPTSTGALGSIGNPYPTINQAINAVSGFTTGVPYTIEIMSGTYTETTSVTITGSATAKKTINLHFHAGANLTVTLPFTGSSVWLTLSTASPTQVEVTISGCDKESNFITITGTTSGDGFVSLDCNSKPENCKLNLNNITINSNKTAAAGLPVEFILIKGFGTLNVNNSVIRSTTSNAFPYYLIFVTNTGQPIISIKNSLLEILSTNATGSGNFSSIQANQLLGTYIIYEEGTSWPAANSGYAYPRIRLINSSFSIYGTVNTQTGAIFIRSRMTGTAPFYSSPYVLSTSVGGNILIDGCYFYSTNGSPVILNSSTIVDMITYGKPSVTNNTAILNTTTPAAVAASVQNATQMITTLLTTRPY